MATTNPNDAVNEIAGVARRAKARIKYKAKKSFERLDKVQKNQKKMAKNRFEKIPPMPQGLEWYKDVIMNRKELMKLLDRLEVELRRLIEVYK